MSPPRLSTIQGGRAQTPRAGKLTLDHVAHFLPDLETAARDFEKLGFTLTPFSAQSHRLEPGGPLVPAGSGNRCIMFKRGYIECLTPTAETPVANELRAAIARYVGVHLIALGTSAPERDHDRLAKQGFAPGPPLALQRTIGTVDGEDTARFTLVRVPSGVMAEGRVQFCQHHTPQLLWQPRWLAHANRAVALTAVIICVGDTHEAAARYARFTGLEPAGAGDNIHIDTERGRLIFATPGVIKRIFNVEPATLPWIVGYALASDDMTATRDVVSGTGLAYGDLGRNRLYVVPPSGVGGIIVFESAGTSALDFALRAV
jgi:hypothetical protein